MRWLALVLVCLSCKGKQAPPKRDDASVRPIDAAVPDAAPDAAPPDAPSMATTITSDGVGPITEDATEVSDFNRLLPGFKVTADRREGEDYEYDEIFVRRGDTLVLRAVVTGSELFKVEVHDPTFATSSGVTVGTTVAEAAAKIADLACRFETYDPEADAERVEKSLRCESPSLRRVMFEVDLESFTGPVGKVSTKTIGKRRIDHVVWLAASE